MTHTVVKILTDEDGEKVAPFWHLSVDWGDGNRTFCTGEVYGDGEGSATYKEKEAAKGGITCSKCLRQIREIKLIKL